VLTSIRLAEVLINPPYKFERHNLYSVCSIEDTSVNLIWMWKPEDVATVQRAWLEDVISLYDSGVFAEERRQIFRSWFEDSKCRVGCIYSISNALSSRYENDLKELGSRLSCIDIAGYEWREYFYAADERGRKFLQEAEIMAKLELL